MESTALQAADRGVPRPIQLVLVRANGPLFYTVTAASLLESIAPLYAQRLLYLVRNDRLLTEWIENEWLPRKAARARLLQDYVERTWPEFDWAAACEHYRGCAEAEGGLGPRRATAAQELLARCVAAAQSGVIYRCLSRWADDPALRAMAAEIAREEADGFAFFRQAYDSRAQLERLSFVCAWRTARACVRTARDTHVPLAFRAITAQCGQRVPFPMLRYSEFLRRMRPVINRYAAPGNPERLLFRPWNGRPRIPKVLEKRQRAPDWFKPVLKAAA
jgi:hypothetical protein